MGKRFSEIASKRMRTRCKGFFMTGRLIGLLAAVAIAGPPPAAADRALPAGGAAPAGPPRLGPAASSIGLEARLHDARSRLSCLDAECTFRHRRTALQSFRT